MKPFAKGFTSRLILFTMAAILVLPTASAGSSFVPAEKRLELERDFTLVRKTDGTLRAWGRNEWGQLGSGSKENSVSPLPVKKLAKIQGISTGTFHSIALKSDGTVWTWGDNYHHQLGDGMLQPRVVPIQVQGLPSILSIGTGRYHSLAVDRQGNVWGWGDNSRGQLSATLGTTVAKPVRISDLTGVVSVSGTAGSTIALKKDGTVWVMSTRIKPDTGEVESGAFQVKGLSGIRQIAGTFYGFAALGTDGNVWYIDDTDTSVPVKLAGFPEITWLDACGDDFQENVTALASDGTVWIWGKTGSPGCYLTYEKPVQITSLKGTVTLACGEKGMQVLAAKADGSLWLWQPQPGTSRPGTEKAVSIWGYKLSS